MLGFSLQPHEDTGTQAIFSFVSLPSPGASGSFLGCPGPGQYRGPERVEDQLCRNLQGGPSMDLCVFLLTYSTGQNSATRPPDCGGSQKMSPSCVCSRVRNQIL